MRRFWSLVLAILILLTSLAAAEPLKSPASATESNTKLSDFISKRLKLTQASATPVPEPDAVETQQPSFSILEPGAGATQQPTLPIPEPGTAETQQPAASSPADVQALPGMLLDLALELLGDQELNLSWEDVYAESRMELTLCQLEGGQLALLCSSDEGDDVCVLIDAEGVTIKADGTSMRYGFDELLEELAFELNLDELTQENDELLALLDILPDLAPSAEDEAFLMQLFEIAADELARAGLDFEPLETFDGTYLHLEFSPKLLCNAIVRFVDRALEYEDEVDALLAHYDAALRALLPELFEIYSPLTQQNVQRAAYTCAELKAVWQLARQELLGQWTDNAGATLEIYAEDYGTSRLNLQIRELPDGGSTVLVLDVDEYGNASGTLTLMQRDYGYGASSYGLAAQVFDIDLSVVSGGMMLRVTPRTPSEGFTMLTANLFTGYDGTAFDLTTDALRLRLHADSESLAGSLELDDAFSADLNLSIGDDIRGSLILSEGRYGYVLRLNE